MNILNYFRFTTFTHKHAILHPSPNQPRRFLAKSTSLSKSSIPRMVHSSRHHPRMDSWPRPTRGISHEPNGTTTNGADM